MIKAVFFDLDETLVDATGVHEVATRQAFKHFGFDYDEIKKMSPHHVSRGKKVVENIKVRVTAAQISERDLPFDKLIAYRESVFINLISKHATLLPGAKEALMYCKEHKAIVAIVSSGSSLYINTVITKYDLSNLIDYTVSGDDVTKGKPDPESYEKAFSQLYDKTIVKDECLIVEDSEAGILAGQGAHIPTLLVNKKAPTMKNIQSNHAILSLQDFKVIIHL
ncbi:hypothetical protein COY90_00090 [Candidatus Roizmanbacteria bacterium CG_4_10_14_0_8_um_filter_39_9]|uniref:HAD family phosphatase n=1 Tax=Candidatus Roizmanbacteria bacterium CG_4_10_14_0_8_um_filter_39_9 TaxID=1974829 RepID=A0A2M7QFK8_9BACT|nr:MAG: hypothetical protein COY90_00090 [Candidatus Roizmanbacteria bacterium CG_4_10_14_0_8_um_filter_39_9]